MATVIWVALHAVQYGIAISGLNGIQSVVTCKEVPPGLETKWGLKPCVSMSDSEFGFVVSIFSLGGLAAALATRAVLMRVGIVGALRLSATTVIIGATLLAGGNTAWTVLYARIIIGVGCGFATGTVPLALASIAPPSMRRSLGTVTQLAIVIGIAGGMLLAFPFGKAYSWRGVPAVSALLGVAQLIASLWVKPISIAEDHDDAREDVPLLGQEREALTVSELLTTTDDKVTNALPLVLISQVFQQLTGASAVMYFSTTILHPIFPSSAKLISLYVVLLKLPMTIVPALTIERLGPKPLLLLPTLLVALSHASLAVGLNQAIPGLAIAGVMAFVTFFSIGLGPVPWVVLGTSLPPYARAAASTVALTINWSLNFLIGAGFMPLQEWLADGQISREGNIFYVFATFCAVGFVFLREAYRRLERV